MSEQKKGITHKTIEELSAILGNFRGVPDRFCDDFNRWAYRWQRGESNSYGQKFSPWGIEIRPYHISELAKQPGMPGRTSLHQIINRLGLDKLEVRNSAGRLTPDTVLKLVKCVASSAGSSAFLEDRREPDDES